MASWRSCPETTLLPAGPLVVATLLLLHLSRPRPRFQSLQLRLPPRRPRHPSCHRSSSLSRHRPLPLPLPLRLLPLRLRRPPLLLLRLFRPPRRLHSQLKRSRPSPPPLRRSQPSMLGRRPLSMIPLLCGRPRQCMPISLLPPSWPKTRADPRTLPASSTSAATRTRAAVS